MKTIESVNQLNTLIHNENVIVLFTADWCPDCKVIEPIMPEIEQEYPDYTFVTVDRDEFIEVCQENDIFGIPSFIAYKECKEAGRFVSKDRKTKEEIIEFMEGLNG